VQDIVDSAKSTVGVPMTAGEQERLRDIAEPIEGQTRRLDIVDAKLVELVEKDVVLRRMATVVGPSCSAAIGALVGSPLEFANARALEKAMGLNLKEKSSGNTHGPLKITKRGPGQVRQLLFMAALRHMKDDATALSWCRARKGYKGDQKMKAVVALMRKLARALWHVARGEAYDPSKLFDTRRLDLPSTPQPPSPSCRSRLAVGAGWGALPRRCSERIAFIAGQEVRPVTFERFPSPRGSCVVLTHLANAGDGSNALRS
jgi:hypothetical protein